MNTTMAPLDQLPQATMEDLRRRHGLMEDSQLRRRKDDSGSNSSNGDGKKNGRDQGKDGSNSNSNGGGNGDSSNNNKNDGGGGGGSNNSNNNNKNKSNGDGSGGGGGGNNNGDKNPSAKDNGPQPSPNEPLEPPQPATTTIIMTSAAAASTTPTTVVITSTVAAAAPSTTSSPPAASLFPTTIAPNPSIFSQIPQPQFASQSDTSSQPRKGLETETPTDSSSSGKTRTKTSTAPTQTIVLPQSVLEPPSQSQPSGQPHRNKDNNKDKDKKGDNGLSPTSERLLIAAGAIGAFIIVLAAVYFILRMKKIDPFSSVRNRQIRRGGSRGIYGWRRESRDRDAYMSDAPPKYREEPFDYAEFAKEGKEQREYDGAFAPSAAQQLARPETAAGQGLSRSGSQRGDLLANSAPMGYSQQQTSPETQADYNNTGRRNTMLSRQQSNATNANGTMATQGTFLSQQTTNLQNTNQMQHMSYLSSLSSGFGDGLIMPDGMTNPNSRQSQAQAPGASRFSWARTATRDRDTVYTTTSEESAPRFRTVNSWVAQQSGRIEKKQATEVPEIPNVPVPVIPNSLQIGFNHQRNMSEDPVFKFHPGDEIQISRGSRVPSEILNKKTGID